MKHLFRTVAILLVATAFPAQADEKRECKAVDSLSVVGYTDFDTVVIKADEDEGECRFSINGAPAGSPPRDAIRAALLDTVGGGGRAPAFMARDGVNYRALATLMLAAGGEDIDAMSERLSRYSDALQTCQTAARSLQPDRKDVDGEFFCITSVPGRRDGYEFGPFASNGVSDGRTGRTDIIVKDGRVWTLLSLPLIRR